MGQDKPKIQTTPTTKARKPFDSRPGNVIFRERLGARMKYVRYQFAQLRKIANARLTKPTQSQADWLLDALTLEVDSVRAALVEAMRAPGEGVKAAVVEAIPE